MNYHLILSSTVAIALVATPAGAFFGDLDALEKELDTPSSAQADGNLGDLLKELEDTSGTTSPAPSMKSFTDVPANAWYYDYVSAVAEWGIVSGYKDANGNLTGRYGPGDAVTVGAMLKMAMEAALIDTSTCYSSTSDLQHWAAPYVACGRDRNMRVLRGSTELDRPARRGEVLGIIHDAFGDTVSATVSPFSDADGHVYEADIAHAAQQGVVSGDTDANGNPTWTYRPDDGVNRAEAAKIIYEKLRVVAGQ